MILKSHTRLAFVKMNAPSPHGENFCSLTGFARGNPYEMDG